MPNNAYHGGAFFDAVGSDFKTLNRLKTIVSADVLDAWFLPSPKVSKKIQRLLPHLLKNAPPTHAEGLIATIAKTRGLSKENIIVGGGSSDLMFAFFPHFLSSQDRVLILDPMYSEYAHICTHVVGAKLFRHKLYAEEGFIVNVEAYIANMQRVRPKLAVIVNPNSPTGVLLTHSSLLEITQAAAKVGTTVVVDEAYIDYTGAQNSVERDVIKHSNLVVIKTMSKGYALSGARVAYLVAPTAIAEDIRTFIPPWSVSLVAQVAAVEALNDPAYYAKRYHETHVLREEVIKTLKNIPGIKVFSSSANLYLIQLVDIKSKASFIVKELRKDGIFIRSCDSMGTGFTDNFLRIAVKDRATNQKIVKMLGKILVTS